MRPTLDYIVERFDYFNQLCFGGELQRPPIKLNTRYATMGYTSGECCEYAQFNGRIFELKSALEEICRSMNIQILLFMR